MVIVCGARSSAGKNTHVVPAGVNLVTGFWSTNGAILTADPNLTYALFTTPTSNLLVQDCIWEGNNFFSDCPPTPVQEGKTLFVSTVAACSYFIVYETAEVLS
jgi:hypothetical protein